MTTQFNSTTNSNVTIMHNSSPQDFQAIGSQAESKSEDNSTELTANANGLTFFLTWKDLNRCAKPIGLALTHLAVAASTWLMTNPPMENSSQPRLNPKQPSQEYFCDRVRREDQSFKRQR